MKKIATCSLKNVGICFLTMMIMLVCSHRGYSSGWSELKGKHFVIYYTPSFGRDDARTTLRKAEYYYKTIGRLIGYARYSKFWTWDERVKIFIYPDQGSFSRHTGQPAWSTGFADRDKYVFQSRAIVSYNQERKFYNGILPHEISHLILRDYFGSGIQVPLWFDEGIAQLKDEEKREFGLQLMRSLVKRGQYIPLRTFVSMDIGVERDPVKVRLFYAQSVSVIEFLITQYGNYAFGQLCRHLKNGKDFETALRMTYKNSVHSLRECEKRWVQYLKQ